MITVMLDALSETHENPLSFDIMIFIYSYYQMSFKLLWEIGIEISILLIEMKLSQI